MFTNRTANNRNQLQFPVEFLNVDDEAQKYRSLTPLHLAAGNGQLDLVNTLLAEGLDINSEIKYDRFTPLYFAIAKNRLEMVNFHIAHGANVNHKAILGLKQLVLLQLIEYVPHCLQNKCIHSCYLIHKFLQQHLESLRAVQLS